MAFILPFNVNTEGSNLVIILYLAHRKIHAECSKIVYDKHKQITKYKHHKYIIHEKYKLRKAYIYKMNKCFYLNTI